MINYQVKYNAQNEAIGITIDGVYYKIVGVNKTANGQTTTVSTPNAKVSTTDPDIYTWEWYLENEYDMYTLKNAPATETVKTQEKSSFWTGLTADKLFTGVLNAVTSIFGNKTNTATVAPATYGTNPYLVPQTSNNNNTLILIGLAVVAFFLFSRSDKKKS
ncbi:LPXTG cell wall anchor domain-containing protein [Runella sp.]|uniref:LPXTG cell wall anchor domain-containing protein n=1 Tax=Runella sp. TaxID=1960881 RepID=UPI003D0FE6E1